MADNLEDKNSPEEEELYVFVKNDREKVKIRKTTFKGKEYLDIRTYITTQEGEEIPTKKGINIPYELAGELQKGLKNVK
jgi:hypothetical protein